MRLALKPFRQLNEQLLELTFVSQILEQRQKPVQNLPLVEGHQHRPLLERLMTGQYLISQSAYLQDFPRSKGPLSEELLDLKCFQTVIRRLKVQGEPKLPHYLNLMWASPQKFL